LLLKQIDELTPSCKTVVPLESIHEVREDSVLLRIVLAILAATSAHPQSPEIDFFETRVRPILASNCLPCHTDSKLGGLRVDSRADLLRGGKSRPAVSPGNPDDSLLMRAIRHQNPDLKMPMGGKLME
jgi:hypothetical protein